MAQVITNAELTTTEIDGTGTFDLMMVAVKGHMEQEYIAGRIRGAEYAQVYLGAITAVMQNATQFLIGQLNAEDNALLIQAQIAKVNAEKALVDQQVLKVTEEIALVQQQAANLAAEALNIPKQGELLDAQVSKTAADKLHTEQGTANLVAEALNIPKQGLLLDAQKLKIEQEVDNLAAQELIIPKQGTKIDSEVALLGQKKFTEEAQILDVVNGSSVVGTVGKQKNLYQAQTDGFARDAEHKLAKTMIDVWNVQRTTDEGISPAGAGIADAEIKKVVDAAKTGIGVTPG